MACDPGVVDARGEELGQRGAGLVEHAEGAVAGVDELGRGLHDAAQDDRETQLRADRDDRLEEVLEVLRLDPGLGHGPGAYRWLRTR